MIYRKTNKVAPVAETSSVKLTCWQTSTTNAMLRASIYWWVLWPGLDPVASFKCHKRPMLTNSGLGGFPSSNPSRKNNENDRKCVCWILGWRVDEFFNSAKLNSAKTARPRIVLARICICLWLWLQSRNEMAFLNPHLSLEILVYGTKRKD